MNVSIHAEFSKCLRKFSLIVDDGSFSNGFFRSINALAFRQRIIFPLNVIKSVVN